MILAITVGRVFAYIGMCFTGLILGALVALAIIVTDIRKRLRSAPTDDYLEELPPEDIKHLQRYISNCEDATEKILRKSFRKKKRLLILKLIDKIKERSKNKKLKNTPIEPPDGAQENDVVEEKVSYKERLWYPFYLLAHNIAVLYKGEEPLAFLELNEKDIFGIIGKITNAIERLLDGVGIDYVKKVKASFILETMNIVRVIMTPFGNKTVKSAFKTSLQAYSEVMKIKNAISINPFYYLRKALSKRINAELTVECVKCAIDVLAIEIVKIYS